MGPEVKGKIAIDADFSQAEKRLADFVRAIERNAKLKKSSINRMTQPLLKDIFDKWQRHKTYDSNYREYLKERTKSYLTSKARMGAFGEEYKNLSKEAKQTFIENMLKDFLPYMSKTIKEEGLERKRQKIQLKRDQEERARKFMSEEKWNTKMNLLHDKALKENKAFDEKKKKLELKEQQKEFKEKEKNRKKLFNALLFKWGKLGIAGMIAGQAIRYISKGVGLANSVAQTSLGYERTIEGGASEGGFFGGSLAAMQRAGISAQTYGSWKRSMLGKVGAIKLGMGNAAPFAMLGVSALDKMDDIELEIEKRLQRLPAETSWALGSQMGLSYDLWAAMYRGEIDRTKPGYDEDAIKAWAEAAKNINEFITAIKVPMYNVLGYLAKMLTTKEGWAGLATGGLGSSMYLPGSSAQRAIEMLIKIDNEGKAKVETNNIENENIRTFIELNQ
jgi:hypothetical protein